MRIGLGNHLIIKNSIHFFSLFLIMYLTIIGFTNEIQEWDTYNYSSEHILDILVSIFLLLIYLIPLLIVGVLISKRLFSHCGIIIISLLLSFFSLGWIASDMNGIFENFILSLVSESKSFVLWKNSIVAPIIEEPIKLILVMLLSLSLRSKNLRTIFLIGFGVGLGFEFSEDIIYILSAGNNGSYNYLEEAITRIIGSFSSHWLYTSILSVGVGSIVLNDRNFSKMEKYLLLISPIFFHVMKNSPISNVYFSAFNSSISLLIFYWLTHKLVDSYSVD